VWGWEKVEREAFVMEMVVGPTGSWYRPPAQPTDVSGTFLAQDGDNGGTTPTRAKSITTPPPSASFFYILPPAGNSTTVALSLTPEFILTGPLIHPPVIASPPTRTTHREITA